MAIFKQTVDGLMKPLTKALTALETIKEDEVRRQSILTGQMKESERELKRADKLHTKIKEVFGELDNE